MRKTFRIGGRTAMAVDVEVTFRCRCGAVVHAGHVLEPAPQDGAAAAGDGVVIHGEPHCAEFRDMEVTDFMRWVRTGLAPEEAN